MRTITHKTKGSLHINENGTYDLKWMKDKEVEETFNVKIKDDKIIEEPIRQQGIGQGQGETTTGIARWIIEEKIEDLTADEIVRKAIENQSVGFYDGISSISLKSGEFYGYGMESRNSNHACDNNEIELHRVFSYEDSIDLESEEFEFTDFEVSQDFYEKTKEELDDFYADITL